MKKRGGILFILASVNTVRLELWLKLFLDKNMVVVLTLLKLLVQFS